MDKVIVTGGAGFIGSHLCDLLLKKGFDITVIDNFSTGRAENLEHLRSSRRAFGTPQDDGVGSLTLIQADIRDYNAIEPLFEGVKWVFHLAALADIVPSIEQPQDYHSSNVDGTVNVLRASKKHNIEKIVYAASSSCYGLAEEFPTPETAPIKPQYPYALTKNVAEQYIMHWAEVYKLPAVCLRLFNVFGTRSRTSGTYGAVFGVFLAQKLAGKPFTVVGDGTQTRDFTYVTDVANAFYTAAKSDIKNEIFNVGSDNTYSINRLVELLGGDVSYIPKRPGEPDCTYADISKIKKMLNWKPQVSFEQGVQNVLDNIDYWKEAVVWDEKTIERATEKWFEYLK